MRHRFLVFFVIFIIIFSQLIFFTHGQNEQEVSSNKKEILWKKKVGHYAGNNQVIFWKGKILVLSSNKLIAVNSLTNSLVWKVVFSHDPFFFTIVNDTIYTSEWNLSALNLNGKFKWVINNPVPGGFLMPASDGILVWDKRWNGGGKVYYVSSTGNTYKIENGVLALAYYNHTIYAGKYNSSENQSYLYAITTDGDIKWVFNGFSKGDIIKDIKTDENGTIYALTLPPKFWVMHGGDSLYAIGTNGNLKWVFRLSQKMHCIHLGEDTILTGSEGVIYMIMSNYTHLFIVKLKTENLGDSSLPKLLWMKNINLFFEYDQISIDKINNLYLGYPLSNNSSPTSSLCAISSEGLLQWSVKINDWYTSNFPYVLKNCFAIGDNGIIYAVGVSGYLYAIGGKNMINSEYIIIIVSAVILIVAVASIISWRRNKGGDVK